VPSSEQSPRRRDAYATYYYRRPLGVRELLPAIGVAIGAGLLAFYVTRLLMQRTPLRVERSRKRYREERSGSHNLERSARA
jgi:hypothetical protein